MSKTTKIQKAKKNKPVNTKEIKAWLRGILEFQPDGWTPSAEQWVTIREKIFNLEEFDSTQQTYNVEPQEAYTYREPEFVYTPVMAQKQAVSALGTVASSGASPVQDSGHVAIARSPTESGVVSASNSGVVLEGEYKSGFA